MAMQVCTKVTSKLKFLYRKKMFLSNKLRRVLYNTLIQPHFDYACVAWYPNLNKNYKNKIQVLQNKCIRFCLQLDNREHIRTEHFDKINWLAIDQRFNQCLSTSVERHFLKCVLNILYIILYYIIYIIYYIYYILYYIKLYNIPLCPQYVLVYIINEIHKTTNQNDAVTRNSSLEFFQPLRTKALSQKCLSYLGPFI